MLGYEISLNVYCHYPSWDYCIILLWYYSTGMMLGAVGGVETVRLQTLVVTRSVCATVGAYYSLKIIRPSAKKKRSARVASRRIALSMVHRTSNLSSLPIKCIVAAFEYIQYL